MRRFTSVFVATVAGLVVLLRFKTAPAKAPRPVALSGATPAIQRSHQTRRRRLARRPHSSAA